MPSINGESGLCVVPRVVVTQVWTIAIGTDVNSHSISLRRNGSISESWFESYSGGSLDEASHADTKLTKTFCS
jgi:hypothetical protein